MNSSSVDDFIREQGCGVTHVYRGGCWRWKNGGNGHPGSRERRMFTVEKRRGDQLVVGGRKLFLSSGCRTVCFLPTWQKTALPLCPPFKQTVPPRGTIQFISKDTHTHLTSNEHEKCGLLFFNFPPSTISLFFLSVTYISIFPTPFLILLLRVGLFEVEAHYGWEKNFGSISTEVISRALDVYYSSEYPFLPAHIHKLTQFPLSLW